MKNILIPAMCVVTLVVYSTIASADTNYTTVYYQEPYGLTIDGDISDWDDIQAPIQAMMFDPTDKFNPRSLRGPDDLSVDFQCFADNYFVYFSFNVTDDVLNFGEEMFHHSLWDDAVFINCDPIGENQTRIRMCLTASESMTPRLEYWDKISGSEQYTKGSYPYLLEALGVQGAIQVTDTGYTAEMAIPYSVVGTTENDATLKIIMNAGVADDDDGEDHDHMMRLAGEGLVKMTFLPGNFGEEAAIVSEPETTVSSQYEVDIMLGAPSTQTSEALIDDLLIKTWNNEWQDVIESLSSQKDQPWVHPMRTWAQYRSGDIESAVDGFEEIVSTVADEHVVVWAQYFLGEIYLTEGMESDAERIYAQLIDNQNWVVYGEAMDFFVEKEMKTKNPASARNFAFGKIANRPLNSMRVIDTAHVFEQYGDRESAIELLEREMNTTTSKFVFEKLNVHLPRNLELKKEFDRANSYHQYIIQTSKDKKTVDKAHLQKARNHYYMERYEEVGQIADMLVAGDCDPKIKFGARMLRISLQRKIEM
jgi:hypothetical protein